MSKNSMLMFWAGIGVLLIIAEARKVLRETKDKLILFTMIGISAGGMAAALILTQLTGSLWISAVVFFSINFIARKLIVGRGIGGKAEGFPASREFLRGKEGVVIEKIVPERGTGIVLVEGLVRKAVSADGRTIEERQMVRVIDVVKRTVSMLKMIPTFGIAEEEIVVVRPISGRRG